MPLQPPFVIDFRLLWGGGSFFFMSIYKAMIVNLRSYKTAIRQTSSFGYPPPFGFAFTCVIPFSFLSKDTS